MLKKLIPLGAIFSVLAAFIWVVISADKGTLPTAISQLYQFPNGDKIGHLVVLGILTFVVSLSSNILMHKSKKFWIIHIAVSLLLVLGMTLEEFSQARIPTRTFSYKDLLFSYGGFVWGYSLSWLLFWFFCLRNTLQKERV